MTARERRELQGYVSRGASGTRAVLFAGALLLVGAALRALQLGVSSWTAVETSWPLWALPTLAAGVWLYRTSRRWTGGAELRERIRADLAKGEVVEHHVVVAQAIHAEEVEDEGPVIFVRDEEGERLFFAGQFLSALVGRGFPWSAFRIVEAPVSGRFLHVRSEGPRFPALERRAPFPYERKKALGMLERSYGRLELDLEAVRTDVGA